MGYCSGYDDSMYIFKDVSMWMINRTTLEVNASLTVKKEVDNSLRVRKYICIQRLIYSYIQSIWNHSYISFKDQGFFFTKNNKNIKIINGFKTSNSTLSVQHKIQILVFEENVCLQMGHDERTMHEAT